MQTLGTYIDKWQVTVVEWVALMPILEFCNRETGYERGGRQRETWWRKMAAWKQQRTTLEEISVAAMVRRQESSTSRRGEGEGGGEVADYDSGREGPWYSGMETGDARVGE